MKIGIVSQPLKNNYGGILQNYALQQVLIKLGYEPITITLIRNNNFFKYLLSQCKTLILMFFPKRKRPFLKYKKTEPQSSKLEPFIIHQIKRTFPIHHITDRIVKQYSLNVLICGSDQVWRRAYNNLNDTYFSYVKTDKIKKIAYGASFGVSRWEYTTEQTKKFSYCARKFDAISVREASAVILCKKFLKIHAVEVLDPTLLIDKEHYLNLTKNIKNCEDYFLGAYILDMTIEKNNFIKQMAEQKGLKLSLYSAGKNASLTVEEWISKFRDASYIITDSFHGTVFSIIFHKPFVSIINKTRGIDRFHSLLSKLNIGNRIIDIDIADQFHENEIDWNSVDTYLKNYREKSMNFIKNNLSH